MDRTERSQHPRLLSNIKQKAIIGPVITKNRDLEIGISIKILQVPQSVNQKRAIKITSVITNQLNKRDELNLNQFIPRIKSP